MALADIRQFLFYIKYLWGPTDFQNMQLWLQSEYRGLSEGAHGGAVLSGLGVSIATGLTVDVASGIATAPDGRLIVAASAAQATFASPVGNPAKSLLILRPKTTDATVIPEPSNPSNNVYLHQKFEYDLLVLNGTPGVTPSYPSTQSNDVILLGVNLTAGQTNLALADFDFSVVSYSRKSKSRVRNYNSGTTYSVASNDKHIDIDATGGNRTALLPNALSVIGEEFTFVRTDSSGNAAAVSGAELISGQNQWTLDDQWATLTVRSVGTGYRVV